MRRGIGRLRAGGSAGVAPPPSTNQSAWFRKGVGITSSLNAVSQWADQSGNVRHLAQASGAAQPTLQAGGTILFDGTNDFLSVSYTAASPRTRYMRFRHLTHVVNNALLSGTTVNTGLISQQFPSPSLMSFNGSAFSSANAAATLGTWASLAVTFGNSTGDVLNIGATTVTGINTGAAVINGICVGANGGGTGWANVEVAEVIDYSAEHDAATRASIIAYLDTL